MGLNPSWGYQARAESVFCVQSHMSCSPWHIMGITSCLLTYMALSLSLFSRSGCHPAAKQKVLSNGVLHSCQE